MCVFISSNICLPFMCGIWKMHFWGVYILQTNPGNVLLFSLRDHASCRDRLSNPLGRCLSSFDVYWHLWTLGFQQGKNQKYGKNEVTEEEHPLQLEPDVNIAFFSISVLQSATIREEVHGITVSSCLPVGGSS